MIITPLMPHQRKALAFAKRKTRTACFMGLGLGKSLVALAWAHEIGAKRILITSDKNNVLNTWPDQIYRHTDYNVMVRPKGEVKIPEHTCVVTNYDQFRTHRANWFARQDWDCWIADESAEIKDQRTQRAKGLTFALEFVHHRLLLNGKAATERLEDLWGQMLWVDGGEALGRSIYHFRQRFMMEDVSGFGWVPKPGAYTRIVKVLEDKALWLEADATIKLPKTHYVLCQVQMTQQQKEIDDELKDLFAASFKGSEIETAYAPVLYAKRLQLCGGIFRPSDPKAPIVQVDSEKTEAVSCLLDQNAADKIVLWHQYRPEGEILTNIARKLRGASKVFDHTDLEGFRKARRGVLVISNARCKGLNQMADADIACFYSLPLSYQKRAQAEGRSRRLSSKITDTYVVDITTQGGADASVYQSLINKRSFSMRLPSLRRLQDGEATETEEN